MNLVFKISLNLFIKPIITAGRIILKTKTLMKMTPMVLARDDLLWF